jgi:hypothetical protein
MRALDAGTCRQLCERAGALDPFEATFLEGAKIHNEQRDRIGVSAAPGALPTLRGPPQAY